MAREYGDHTTARRLGQKLTVAAHPYGRGFGDDGALRQRRRQAVHVGG
jgi:hypothetical protein